MALFRTIAPTVEPVSLSGLKGHLRLDDDREDALLEALIRAAREEFERTTGTALVEQSWRLTLDRLPASGSVLLRRTPVRAVTAVTIYGSQGEAAALDPSNYLLDAHSNPARLQFTARPAPHKILNGIEIDFTAGHGESAADVPDLARRAVTLLAAHWFEFRTAFRPSDHPVSLPPGYRSLISPFMQRRLE